MKYDCIILRLNIRDILHHIDIITPTLLAEHALAQRQVLGRFGIEISHQLLNLGAQFADHAGKLAHQQRLVKFLLIVKQVYQHICRHCTFKKRRSSVLHRYMACASCTTISSTRDTMKRSSGCGSDLPMMNCD